MLSRMYPFWSFMIAVVVAQGAKPFVKYLHTHKFDWRLLFASGGFPSSHTAGVAAMTLAVGIAEHFDSTIFAVSLAVAIIVSYDAANVRYYAGKNITVTKRIIKDLHAENLISADEPLYYEKIKDVLGHKWSEVLGGCILGLFISILLYYCTK